MTLRRRWLGLRHALDELFDVDERDEEGEEP
jgi:hypothetical protein